MQFVPHPYQERAIDFVLSHPFCMLLLDMGLGKSVITLTAISRLIEDVEVRRVLIVAPKSVAESTWSAEVEKWNHLAYLRVSRIIGSQRQRREALDTDADIYVISRDNLTWLVRECRRDLRGFDVLVLDELTSFKNAKAQRFKAVRAVRGQFDRIIGLTGTPAPNGYLDLWAQVFCIDGGERLGRTIGRYRDRYFRIDNPYVTWPTYVLAPGAQTTINEKIADISLSMRASDYLALPDRIPILTYVNLDDKEQAAYERFEREQILTLFTAPPASPASPASPDSAERFSRSESSSTEAPAATIPASPDSAERFSRSESSSTEAPASPDSAGRFSRLESSSTEAPAATILAASAAALASKLAQFANGAVYDEDHAAHVVHDAKIRALLDIIEAAASPVLVFYAYIHDAERILGALPKSVRACLYHGTDSLEAWNAGRIDVLLCHPASTAYGLNMQQGGHIIVWFGLTWNLEHYQQANARLHRQGQQQPVRIYHLVAKGTIDERAYSALQGKAGTQDALIDAVKKLVDKYY